MYSYFNYNANLNHTFETEIFLKNISLDIFRGKISD